MENISIHWLFASLFLLILLSAFFSSSETAIIALNRYKLRHLVKQKHLGAIMVSRLLERPDRFIGLVLLCNNLVNIIAASVATVISYILLGNTGVIISPFVVTVVFLIFAEVVPKTVAAAHPEKIAFWFIYILSPLMKVLYPVVWLINIVANNILKVCKIDINQNDDSLSLDELRTVVREIGGLIPKSHQSMLLNILDLENVSVSDVMVTKKEVFALDLSTPDHEIIKKLKNARNYIPVYDSNIDNIHGVIPAKKMLRILDDKNKFSIDLLKNIITDCHFTMEDTSLHSQLLYFQKNKQHFAIVVDEYGVFQGFITLEDILEEIVGKFSTQPQAYNLFVQQQEDGSYLVDGFTTIREINKLLKFQLPTEGPKTLNGLVLEHLESIPQIGTTLKIHGYMIEIMNTAENAVRMARIKALDKVVDSSDNT